MFNSRKKKKKNPIIDNSHQSIKIVRLQNSIIYFHHWSIMHNTIYQLNKSKNFCIEMSNVIKQRLILRWYTLNLSDISIRRKLKRKLILQRWKYSLPPGTPSHDRNLRDELHWIIVVATNSSACFERRKNSLRRGASKISSGFYQSDWYDTMEKINCRVRKSNRKALFRFGHREGSTNRKILSAKVECLWIQKEAWEKIGCKRWTHI